MLIGATMADRFLFVPSIGFTVAMTWVILKLTKTEAVKSLPKKAMYVLLPLTLLYSIRTFSRSQDWSDETNLFTRDVENSPGSGRVHYNYGVILKGQADQEKNDALKNQLYEQALEEFKTAAKIDSSDYQSYAGAGEVEFKSGKYPESVYWRTKSLQAEPKNILLLRDLGTSLMKSNKYDSAIVIYKQAIDKNASDSLTWILAGEAYLLEHDTLNALNAFENDVKNYPNFILGWNKLGNLRGMHRDIEKSTEAFQKIIQLDPDNLDAYRMLYTNYTHVGDSVNAKKVEQEYYRRGGK
jgi:tetratricopeptide (TPR) repeat protein